MMKEPIRPCAADIVPRWSMSLSRTPYAGRVPARHHTLITQSRTMIAEVVTPWSANNPMALPQLGGETTSVLPTGPPAGYP